MPNLVHGTAHGYNLGCRCDECRECNRLRMKARREHIRSLRKLINGRWVTTVSLAIHGTTNAYENWQCRCIPCTEQHRIDMRNYYEKTKRKSRRKSA